MLYESPTTRVFRSLHPQPYICKEQVGPDAARRMRHETSLLQRLKAIEGIARLAVGIEVDGMLVLHDHGGTTLAQQLQAGPVDADTLVKLAMQLARTLAEIHRRGVVHRDVNPTNIVMSSSGDAVLIDFDLAGMPGQPGFVPPDGEVMGTLAYLAPEQSGRTGRAVDQRADLYALGVTLYEAATGRLPFESLETLNLIHQHLAVDPVPPHQLDARVPAGLSAIVLRLMAKAPEQRYQSADGLLNDLRLLRQKLDAGDHGMFELGERDFPARLAPPRQLVARDAELASLAGAFARALDEPQGAVLVEGAAGVGKSVLIHELRALAAAAGGWFVHGKFDQFQKDAATAGAVTQTTQAVARLLLALPPQDLAAQRQRILSVLGHNAGLMTRLAPEFGLLLGAHPAVPEVDPSQAEERFQQAILDLLTAIVSPERPLVVVFDDLHWAGPASLRGFARMVSESGVRGLLLVGAYRPEEVGPDDVLTPMLAQWSQLAAPPLRIALGNLDEGSTGLLLEKMLRLGGDRALELARAVRTLSAGNPFDTLEMVNALRADGVLGHDNTGWHWNSDEVRHYVGASNVVDLLKARIERLPAASRELVEFMSCLGNSVEFQLLAAAVRLGARELEERLGALLEDGLLLAESVAGQRIVRFRHDRVQQAVMGALPGERRMHHQLAMARSLSAHPAYEHEAAAQYLPCAGALREPAEQRLAARLFVDLARRLASTATYQLAERYLAAASDLLEQGEPDTAMRATIDKGRHAALYSLGRLQESDPVFAALRSRATDALEMVEPTCLQMRSLFMRGQTEQAKTLGLDLLKQLGLQVPPNYDAPDTHARMDGLAQWVREDSQLDHGRRKCIQDERLLAIAKVLGRLTRPAYFPPDSKAFQWLLLQCQRLWAEHGPCPELVSSLGRMSSMLITLRGDYRTAYEVSRHVLAVGQALGWEPQTSEARFLFATFAGHWFEPLEQVFRQLTQACEGVRSSGDASYAGYVHAVLITSLLEINATVGASMTELQAGIAMCQRAGNVHAAAQHMCELQMLRALAGQTTRWDSFDDGQFSEQDFLARVGQLPYMQHTYAECRAMHGLIMGEADILVPHAVLGKAQSGDVAGYYMSVYANLFHALARAWQLRAGVTAEEREHLTDELQASRAWLAARAVDQPANFAHLLRLVEAEQAWAIGDMWGAAAAFDAAFAEPGIRARPWHRAVITERAGLFHLATGVSHMGRRLVADARDQFLAWGAKAKVAVMQSRYDFLSEPQPGETHKIRAGIASAASMPARASTSGLSSGEIDLLGVLRASQALSSETSPERLATRVTQVLAALTGATRVHVLAWIDDDWLLLAPSPGESSIPVAVAGQRGVLPLSVCSYAQRTGEALVVDDVLADDRFWRDRYFAFLPRCSVMVAPIVGQGNTRAMLYLENTQGTSTFSAQRLEAVMLIAGQLAVSLANAWLYESLEERVRKRTVELEEMQERLVDTARRAGKAEVANNVLHNVGNVLNSVTVSTSLVRTTLANSRLSGFDRALQMMKDRERQLASVLPGDMQGAALLAYLDSLATTLQQEQKDALDNLDRVTRSVDHISYVVAAQQSHAGASTVVESAQPQDILEEARDLCNDVIARGGIDVTLRSEANAAMLLDRSRLLQILVNLVRNAAQAMEGMPAGARQLILSASVVEHELGEYLRIAVQDVGEGIPQELLTRIFAHGVSARKGGHGFGLHSSALAAMEMDGKLTAHSDGPGRGSTFVLEVPAIPA
ncbi:AAA family ATPase [Caenimonas koreensis]|uniref:AAA family ATPase n=1 Tax=Caenimonas koreensis TaxID=367474 RepID=UPI0037835F48